MENILQALRFAENHGLLVGEAYAEVEALQKRIAQLEAAQQSAHWTCAKCGSEKFSRYAGDGNNWFCSDCGASQ